jgi:uncharacterized protein (TIGR02271 family)
MLTPTPYALTVGDEVFGSDGDKLGNVVAVDPNYVVIEKGWFFPTDYYIPMSAVAAYDEGKATLNVTKDVALNQGWDIAPPTSADGEWISDTLTNDGQIITEAPIPGGRMEAARGDVDYSPDTDLLTTRPTDTGMTDDTTVGATGAAGYTGNWPAQEPNARVDGDTLTVPVHEEELIATTSRHEVGGARIEKTVEAVDQTLDVPVHEERLRVVRRTVDREVTAADSEGQVFEDVIVDVPITVEEVEVGTRARVAEELVIQREDVERTEQVHGTVRKEHVKVTEAMPGRVTGDVPETGTTDLPEQRI